MQYKDSGIINGRLTECIALSKAVTCAKTKQKMKSKHNNSTCLIVNEVSFQKTLNLSFPFVVSIPLDYFLN